MYDALLHRCFSFAFTFVFLYRLLTNQDRLFERYSDLVQFVAPVWVR
jgi:hypothetical protein